MLWVAKPPAKFFFSSESVQIRMKDAESAESKEKSNFWFLQFIFRVMVIFVLKSSQFSMNFHDKSKNKNWKIDLSFVSAHWASSIKTGSKMSAI